MEAKAVYSEFLWNSFEMSWFILNVNMEIFILLNISLWVWLFVFVFFIEKQWFFSKILWVQFVSWKTTHICPTALCTPQYAPEFEETGPRGWRLGLSWASLPPGLISTAHSQITHSTATLIFYTSVPLHMFFPQPVSLSLFFFYLKVSHLHGLGP